MTVRDRLAGKQRRRASVRVVIDVEAAGAAASLVHQRDALLAAVRLTGDQVLVDSAEADLERARAALEGAYETLLFDALDPDAYEALLAGFVDESGYLDHSAALPSLAAACVTDESLMDAQWWTDELASGRWNAGEIADLLTTLVELNYAVPGPGPGKG